ncbi:MAG TPA: AAA family ATPase, partial [Nannocystis sp.]
MKPHWRLHVEDFGRIAAADVDLRRLTLFVGPNNSGKSYLASLLWGLVALQFDLPTVAGPELDAVDEWLAQKI